MQGIPESMYRTTNIGKMQIKMHFCIPVWGLDTISIGGKTGNTEEII